MALLFALRAPVRRTAAPFVPFRTAGTAGGGGGRAAKEASAVQMKRAQSLRLMTAGMVSLAGAFIIMRAQATGKTKRTLEQAQREAREALAKREAEGGK